MSDVFLTQADRGRIVTVKPGDEIVTRLEENIATGYIWEVATLDPAVITLLASDHVPSSDRQMGSTGLRVLRAQAKAPGVCQIQLSLRKSWEPPDAAINHFEVTIRVQ